MELRVCDYRRIGWGDAACLVVPLFEGEFPLESALLREADEEALQELADRGLFRGKAQECFLLPVRGREYKAVLVAGLGKQEKFGAEMMRRAAGKACGLLRQHRIRHAVLDVSRQGGVPAAAFLEGLVLGQYEFDVYKKTPEDAPPKVEVASIAVDDAAACQEMKARCERALVGALSANAARHLANKAPNELTPVALAEFAQGIAQETGCECTVLEEKQMASLGMNALLAVAQGSAQPPRLIILRHVHGAGSPTVAIVGKGVTFDTGGISIKPAQAMHEMKYDMCGAAAALCTMMTLPAIRPAANVLCVVPAVENMPGGGAMRPGDIVRAYNGKTIEIHNTDAEGRLILADAMAYAVEKYAPARMVDLATLTGACVIALGHFAAGLFSTDDALSQELIAAGESSGERLWRMPLWEEYDKLIEGTHADICNVGPREGGAITAAAFLKQFVGETPWAHIDMAGTAWEAKEVSYLDPKHATGYGVRLLMEWLAASYARG